MFPAHNRAEWAQTKSIPINFRPRRIHLAYMNNLLKEHGPLVNFTCEFHTIAACVTAQRRIVWCKLLPVWIDAPTIEDSYDESACLVKCELQHLCVTRHTSFTLQMICLMNNYDRTELNVKWMQFVPCSNSRKFAVYMSCKTKWKNEEEKRQK